MKPFIKYRNYREKATYPGLPITSNFLALYSLAFISSQMVHGGTAYKRKDNN